MKVHFSHERELNFLLYRIDAVDANAHALSEAKGFARALADDLARVFVVGVAVIRERLQRDEAFDEEVGEFDEEAVFGHADDEAIEILPMRRSMNLAFFHSMSSRSASSARRSERLDSSAMA